MAIYRDNLPQMRGGLFLSAGVIETSGGDHEGMEQSSFTALQLPDDVERTAAMRTFYSHCVEVAKAAGMGLILESPTWRPSHDRTGEPQPSRSDLERASRHVMGLLEGIRAGVEDLELVVSGCLGPWGDGDEPGQRMSVQEAHDYYVSQIRILTDAKADMLCALTLHYPEEAIGIAKAA